MAKSTPRIPPELQRWIDARKRFHLSHAQVQMARELGMNPRKLGRLANHRQEPWKAPLPIFIERIYQKRFGKARPDRVLSLEGRVREVAAKKAKRRERRADNVPLDPHKQDPDTKSGDSVRLDEKSVLREFVEEAIRLGADTLQVEYNSPNEEIYFVKNGSGIGTTLDSSSDQDKSLRQELHALAKRKRCRFAFAGAQYELRTRVYESFGENAFEVMILRL